MVPMNRQQRIAAALTAFEGLKDYDRIDKALRQGRPVPLSLGSIEDIALRIKGLQEIAIQSELTADDLPQAGWGIPDAPVESGDGPKTHGDTVDVVG